MNKRRYIKKKLRNQRNKIILLLVFLSLIHIVRYYIILSCIFNFKFVLFASLSHKSSYIPALILIIAHSIFFHFEKFFVKLIFSRS